MIPKDAQVTELRAAGDGLTDDTATIQSTLDLAAGEPKIKAAANEPTVLEGPADRGDAPAATAGGDCCEEETQP